MFLLVALSMLLCAANAQTTVRCSNLPVESLPGQKDYWVGGWRYWEDSEKGLEIFEDGRVSGGNFDDARCEEIKLYKNDSATSAYYWGNMIVSKNTGSGSRCYGCLKIEQRTIAVMEFKQSACSYDSVSEARDKCEGATSATKGQFFQLFRRDQRALNCRNTYEGVFQFNYEWQDNEGICDNVENRIVACQEPGSSFKDNVVFTQQFKKCPGNQASIDQQYEWRCLGSWKDPYRPNRIYSAIWDNTQVIFERQIRCMLTFDNQQLPNNQQRRTMSSKPTCNELASDYQGPLRLQTVPDFTPEQLEELQPSCMLPQNFSGTWFTSSQYDSDVSINATHIQFQTRYTTFSYVDTFFSCQQTRDTRYLMKQVTQGKCEVDYVCFEFLPRHQNVIRFRMGKPFRAEAAFWSDEALQNIFATACSWSAFTVSRTENRNYVYQTFILNPPAPVECPIGGIYNFTQIGLPQFVYKTKIRGVTERPRVSYVCDNPESEFKVCAQNPKIVNLDVERCATLDHVGRPIGEYDEPDNYLQCVGYWQENQQSYLVTYDTEDAVAPFRCWVYERLGWKDIRMSRALRAACGSNQTPRSTTEAEGASLSLELRENEREFDDCPQRFLDGRDPYMKSTTVYVVGAATLSHRCSILLLAVASLLQLNL